MCVCMCSMWVLPISGRRCSYSLETRQSAQTSARTQSVVVDTFSCQTILMKINLKEKALQTKLNSLRKINPVKSVKVVNSVWDIEFFSPNINSLKFYIRFACILYLKLTGNNKQVTSTFSYITTKRGLVLI